jgi:protein MpaA
MDTKFRWFARRLANELNLPRDWFDCGGTCYGTMTSWYNARYAGGALTVEYGRYPSRRRMTYYAPRQLLRAIGGWRV